MGITLGWIWSYGLDHMLYEDDLMGREEVLKDGFNLCPLVSPSNEPNPL